MSRDHFRGGDVDLQVRLSEISASGGGGVVFVFALDASPNPQSKFYMICHGIQGGEGEIH